MPGQIIPIQDIASGGLFTDTPSIALPPNVYSNMENMRLEDGAARKMTGELSFLDGLSNVVYVAYWNHPVTPRYIIVETAAGAVVSTIASVSIGTTPVRTAIVTDFSTDGARGTIEWQHTEFNGGFSFILNNGVTAPRFLQDDLTGMPVLPNWDSYQSQETVTGITWNALTPAVDIGRAVDFTMEVIDVVITPRNPSTNIITYTITADVDVAGQYTLDNTLFTFTPGDRSGNDLGALQGDTIYLTLRTIPPISVFAGVIRGYGNLLVAGNLVEVDNNDMNTPTKRLPGVIRTSDVAAPGTIPRNWNPFRNGVNTADEFVLSSTGRVQDMVELQGVLYVYTESSIHAVQQTGQIALPFQISPVTYNYGADNIGSVIELDGKHIVVGSDDVFVFAGHPGSISSIADGRVRFSDFFQGRRVNIVRFQKYDELWFWSPADPEMYVWNYRDNTWTRRSMTLPVSGNQGQDGPIFTVASEMYTVDDDGYSTLTAPYESFLERKRLPLAPEFDTETLSSVALMYSGTADLSMRFEGTNAPGDETEITSDPFPFAGATDWKTDVRVQGRFLNYRISDGTTNTDEWNLSGYQFDIAKGGTR